MEIVLQKKFRIVCFSFACEKCENLAWKIRKFCKFGEKMEIFIKQLLQEKKRNYWLYNIITSQSKEFQKYFLYLQHIMVFAELFFPEIFFCKISRNYFSRNFSSFLHFSFSSFCDISRKSLQTTNQHFRIFSRKFSFGGVPVNTN